MRKFIGLFFISAIFLSCNQNRNTESADFFTTYIFVSAECPMCKNYLPVWQKLIQKYRSANIDFKLVRCNQNDTTGWFDMKTVLNIPIIENRNNQFKRSGLWNIETVPSVVVVRGDNNIIYSGATDDRIVETGTYKTKATRFYLEEVLKQIKNGQIPERKNIPVTGCYIED